MSEAIFTFMYDHPAIVITITVAAAICVFLLAAFWPLEEPEDDYADLEARLRVALGHVETDASAYRAHLTPDDQDAPAFATGGVVPKSGWCWVGEGGICFGPIPYRPRRGRRRMSRLTLDGYHLMSAAERREFDVWLDEHDVLHRCLEVKFVTEQVVEFLMLSVGDDGEPFVVRDGDEGVMATHWSECVLRRPPPPFVSNYTEVAA